MIRNIGSNYVVQQFSDCAVPGGSNELPPEVLEQVDTTLLRSVSNDTYVDSNSTYNGHPELRNCSRTGTQR